MTIVFVPGDMLDADLWRDVEPGLSRWGPVLHADPSHDDSLAAMAGRTLRQAPQQFILVGFSMGGIRSPRSRAPRPDRVSALILIATSARGDTPARAKHKEVLAADAIVREHFGGLSRSAIAQAPHPGRAGSDWLIDRIPAMGRRLGGDAFRRQSLLERQDERSR